MLFTAVFKAGEQGDETKMEAKTIFMAIQIAAATVLLGTSTLMFIAVKRTTDRVSERYHRTDIHEAAMRPAIPQCRFCSHMCEYRGCPIDHKVACDAYGVKDGFCINNLPLWAKDVKEVFDAGK